MHSGAHPEPRIAGYARQIAQNTSAEVDSSNTRQLKTGQREQNLLNWQDFLRQMNNSGSRSPPMKERDSYGLRGTKTAAMISISHANPQYRATNPIHAAESTNDTYAPARSKLIHRSTFPTNLNDAFETPGHAPSQMKKRNSNIKNLSVAVPGVVMPAVAPARSLTMPIAPQRPSRVVENASSNASKDRAVHQLMRGPLQPGAKNPARSAQTVRTTRRQIIRATETSSSELNVRAASDTVATTDDSNIAAMSDLGVDVATSSPQLPLVMNLHLPRAPFSDPEEEKAERDKLHSFKSMLRSFVHNQKQIEATIFQGMIARELNPVAPHTLHRSTSVLGDKLLRSRNTVETHFEGHTRPHLAAVDKMVFGANVLANSTETSCRLDTHKEHDRREVSGADSNVNRSSAIESFQYMKETIAKISQHESYSRSYNAARNFSTNSRHSQTFNSGVPLEAATPLEVWKRPPVPCTTEAEGPPNHICATERTQLSRADSTQTINSMSSHRSESGAVLRRHKSRMPSNGSATTMNDKVHKAGAGVRRKLLAGLVAASDLILPHDSDSKVAGGKHNQS